MTARITHIPCITFPRKGGKGEVCLMLQKGDIGCGRARQRHHASASQISLGNMGSRDLAHSETRKVGDADSTHRVGSTENP